MYYHLVILLQFAYILVNQQKNYSLSNEDANEHAIKIEAADDLSTTRLFLEMIKMLNPVGKTKIL